MKRMARRVGQAVAVAYLVAFVGCGGKSDEPAALRPGAYAFYRETAEGSVAPVLADHGEFTILQRADGPWLDIDATVFSDVTTSTLGAYRWRVEAPLGVTLYSVVTQGYDNDSVGVYRSYRLWQAAVSLDNRTQKGMLAVTFRRKYGDDVIELFTRERFGFRRTGAGPGELRVVDDPFVLEYRYSAGCYHMITENGTYSARFTAFPDLRTGLATSDMECNVDVGYVALAKAGYTNVDIDHANLDFHGAWRISADDVSVTGCGPVRFFTMRQERYGQVVTADSYLTSCAENGGLIYHRW